MTQPSTPTQNMWNVPPTPKERNAVQRNVDNLLDVLAPERATKRGDYPVNPVVAHRTPSGCILQAADTALSVSWFPESADTTALGELHVVLWRGVVSRRGSPKPAQGAVELRDLALRPVERPTDDCVWKASDGTLYATDALATYCLGLLEGQRDEDRASE
ncbi:MAG: hypothetical protein ABJE10_00240 [bacterium]